MTFVGALIDGVEEIKKVVDRLDTSQVDMWERRYHIYDGFFQDKKYIELMAEAVKDITLFFGYDKK